MANVSSIIKYSHLNKFILYLIVFILSCNKKNLNNQSSMNINSVYTKLQNNFINLFQDNSSLNNNVSNSKENKYYADCSYEIWKNISIQSYLNNKQIDFFCTKNIDIFIPDDILFLIKKYFTTIAIFQFICYDDDEHEHEHDRINGVKGKIIAYDYITHKAIKKLEFNAFNEKYLISIIKNLPYSSIFSFFEENLYVIDMFGRLNQGIIINRSISTLFIKDFIKNILIKNKCPIIDFELKYPNENKSRNFEDKLDYNYYCFEKKHIVSSEPNYYSLIKKHIVILEPNKIVFFYENNDIIMIYNYAKDKIEKTISIDKKLLPNKELKIKYGPQFTWEDRANYCKLNKNTIIINYYLRARNSNRWYTEKIFIALDIISEKLNLLEFKNEKIELKNISDFYCGPHENSILCYYSPYEKSKLYKNLLLDFTTYEVKELSINSNYFKCWLTHPELLELIEDTIEFYPYI